MIDLIIGFVIAGVLFVVEYFLCVKLKNPLWGGIIPMLILIGTILIFASGKVPLTIRNVFPFVIANTIFFGDWGTGREKYKKLQQAEMDCSSPPLLSALRSYHTNRQEENQNE